MKIEIVMEKIMRVAKVIDATDEELELLKSGENPFADKLETELESGVIEYNFAVNDMGGKEIAPWR